MFGPSKFTGAAHCSQTPIQHISNVNTANIIPIKIISNNLSIWMYIDSTYHITYIKIINFEYALNVVLVNSNNYIWTFNDICLTKLFKCHCNKTTLEYA